MSQDRIQRLQQFVEWSREIGTNALIDSNAATSREIRHVRTQAQENMASGLRTLYRTLELPGTNPLKSAHAALDAAVLEAYNFDPESDLLTPLLALNLQVAAKIEADAPVTAPGFPPACSDPKDLITDDCIAP